MKKLIFILLIFIGLLGQAQNVFGYDPYDTLKVMSLKANSELCLHDMVKSKKITSTDSLFVGVLNGNKSASGIIIKRKGKVTLNSSSKKNSFKISVFDMKFDGKFDEKTGEIISFIGKSKGMKYKVTSKGGVYDLEEIKFKEKKGNRNQVDELKKNVSTLINFVKQFILIPHDLCKSKN